LTRGCAHEVVGYAAGDAEAPVLFLDEPLNVWGGLDPLTGRIVDRRHPQVGESVAGRLLVLLETRGSGTNAQIIAEAWARGVGPVGVVLGRRDNVLMTGAIVAEELYGVTCPVAVADPAAFDHLRHASRARLTVGGGRAVLAHDDPGNGG
jgi:uncharacterized protein